MDAGVKPRDKQGQRTGFTTGACSAAAAKAAMRCLKTQTSLNEIEIRLPNRNHVTFPLKRCEIYADHVICSVIKDAGDDPDCTHGAELTAEVQYSQEEGIELRGGAGVATVTKAGLGLAIGVPAINPVPRMNITEMVREELEGSGHSGAVVTISVPGGEEMAKKTTNARLGLIGGISILGTTGIVRPYSTAAFRASVLLEIDVAVQCNLPEVVLTTGGKSEQYAMQLHPHLREEAFIQVGDFVGVALKHCARRRLEKAIIVGMMGKLSKMADGHMMTHVAGSEVNLEFLASLAAESGADAALCERIRGANTAREVLEICSAAGITEITTLICKKVVQIGSAHAGGHLPVQVYLVDFNGKLLGQYPAPTESSHEVTP
jgi:cobalt-precorrin-5B (C1)-methyltransferase